MGNIATTDAQGLYTKKLIDVYVERPKPTSFLRSFFPTVESSTKELSIEVQRGTEKVAVDVTRGTDGNRNSFAKSSEKVIVPPYYREYLDITQLQMYDRLFGATEISDAMFAAMINDTADHVMILQEKIERAYELQCAQVLQSGIVQLKKATNIDFKRKPGSMVDLTSGGYWTGSVDPFPHIEAGCKFLRETGKAQGGVFNLILGAKALSALLGNAKFTARQNFFNMKLDDVIAPQRNAVGATLHGAVSAGAYTVILWSYPEVYDHPDTGTSTPYIENKNAVLIPQNPKFKLGFAAVPQLLMPGQPVKTGAYIISEYREEKEKTHEFHLESAGVAIPTAIDQIYTMQVVASN